MLTPEINILAILAAAIIPNAFGALFYGALFGKTWLQSFGKTEEDMKGNEVVTYGIAFVMSFIIAFFVRFVIGMGHKNVNEAGELIIASHETFGHGAFHGLMICIGFIIPVIVSLGLFHKATAKNILLNVVFWAICFALMGGVVDVWQ